MLLPTRVFFLTWTSITGAFQRATKNRLQFYRITGYDFGGRRSDLAGAHGSLFGLHERTYTPAQNDG